MCGACVCGVCVRVCPCACLCNIVDNFALFAQAQVSEVNAVGHEQSRRLPSTALCALRPPAALRSRHTALPRSPASLTGAIAGVSKHRHACVMYDAHYGILGVTKQVTKRIQCHVAATWLLFICCSPLSLSLSRSLTRPRPALPRCAYDALPSLNRILTARIFSSLLLCFLFICANNL